MTAPLLQIDQLGKRFGGFVALDGINLSIDEGERVGLIGPNGSGKSTLVNCITGALRNESGSVTFAGETMNGLAPHARSRRGLARSFQLPRPFASMSVAENIRVPLLYTVNAREGRHLAASEIEDRCMELLTLVALEEKADKQPRDLTQVEMRKLELAHLDLGEVGRTLRGLVVERHQLEHFHAAVVELGERATRAAARIHGVEQRHADVVGHAHAGERARQLKAARKPAPRALIDRKSVV